MHPQQPYQQHRYQSPSSPTSRQPVPGYGYPGNNGYPGNHPAQQPVVVRGDRNGLGTAALVLGILAVIFSFIPLVGVIAWPLGIIGLVLAFVGISRANRGHATNRGVAIGGLATSGVALVICFLWLVGIGIAGSKTPTTSSIPTVAAVPAVPTNAVPAPAKPAGPASQVGDGTYQVGVDMAVGRYKTTGPTDDLFRNCYWQRTRDDSGQLGSIIANDNTQGPASVTVKSGEFFQTSGGCTWTKQ